MTRRILHITLLLAVIAGQALPVSAAHMLCGMEGTGAPADGRDPNPAVTGERGTRGSCDRCDGPSQARLPARAPVLESRTCCQLEATTPPEAAASIVPSSRRAANEAGSTDLALLATTIGSLGAPALAGVAVPIRTPSSFDPLQAHRTTILRR